jgi:hypothetical protein
MRMNWSRLTLVVGGLMLGCGGRSGSHASTGSGGQGGSSGASANGGLAGSAGTSNAPGANAGRSATCSDYVPPPAGIKTCRSTADCDRAQNCLEPGKSYDGCAVCIDPDRMCETAADCGDGFICLKYVEPCVCDALASRCQRACSNSDCEAGMRCNDTTKLCEPITCDDGYTCPSGDMCGGSGSPDEHGCVPILCEDGFECPENTHCSPSASGHGCEALPCATDADCDCGACVNDRCASGPGNCTYIPL